MFFDLVSFDIVLVCGVDWVEWYEWFDIEDVIVLDCEL